MQSTWYFALTKKLLIPLEKIGEPGGRGGGRDKEKTLNVLTALFKRFLSYTVSVFLFTLIQSLIEGKLIISSCSCIVNTKLSIPTRSSENIMPVLAKPKMSSGAGMKECHLSLVILIPVAE